MTIADRTSLMGQDVVDTTFGLLLNVNEQDNPTMEALSHYRVIINSTSDAIIRKTIDGVITGWSRGAETIFGYTASEMLGESIRRLLSADRLDEEARMLDEVRQGREVKPFDTIRLRKDGLSIHVSVSISPISNDLGKITAISTIARDITERIRIEAALADRERDAKQVLQEASDLLEAAPDAMIAVGENGTIRFGNGQAVAMFGYTKDELWGKPINSLIPERLRGKHGDHMGAFFSAPMVRQVGVGLKMFAQHRDGTEFPVEMTLSPAKINGDPLVMAAVRDITARRHLEEALEASRVQMVATARLSALGEMAGGIAHEINNPVAVIHALASDLAEQGGASPAEVIEGSLRIVEYADRVVNIVQGLRNITRDGVRDPFDGASVSRIVRQALDLCKERFRQHSVDLLTSSIDPDMQLECREVQVSQLLINLLQNAFDAVQEQEEHKWVRLEVEAQRHFVVISIIDSGSGVPVGLSEKIMEPFFTTKPVGKGTGLGLSLSRQIAQEHGGTLELQDRGGHTCFCLTLPALHNEVQTCS